MRKPVIAVDGFSSTGKSSISKIIAQKLGLVHIDTGALYRGVTYYALNCCQKDDTTIDLQHLFSVIKDMHLEFRKVQEHLDLFLNGKNVSKEIRTSNVTDQVSLIAAQKEVRDFLLTTQRNLAQNGGVIMDGRDIGTVVFPNADYKFFLTASIEERTSRRFKELAAMDMTTTLSQVRDNLTLRDKIDSERDIAPLRKAEDAILIDNTFMTKEETVVAMMSHIKDFNTF